MSDLRHTGLTLGRNLLYSPTSPTLATFNHVPCSVECVQLRLLGAFKTKKNPNFKSAWSAAWFSHSLCRLRQLFLITLLGFKIGWEKSYLTRLGSSFDVK